MAEEIRNKFVSWTLNVVKEIKEIPAKNCVGQGVGGNIYGVGVNLALVQPTSSSTPTSGGGAAVNFNRVGVDSVEPTGPAARAGLRAGDLIVEVDGRRFDDGRVYIPDDVAARIRGPEGSEVGVVVERAVAGGHGVNRERVSFVLTRAAIGVSPPSSPSNQKSLQESQRQQQQHQQKQKQRQQDAGAAQERKDSKIQPQTKTRQEGNQQQMENETKKKSENENYSNGPAINAVADSLESLALSEEEQKERDLASSSESVDQFDATAPRSHHNLSSVGGSNAINLPRNVSVDEISEEKTIDASEEISSIVGDTDSQWELISERSGSAIVISFSGSVSGTGCSFRSASPSMLKNKFVLTESTGEPYIEHVVLPTDTLQGLCLAYKISATRLRMENGFSGNSLQMAPKKLRIPTIIVGGNNGSSSCDNAAANTTTKGMMIRMQDRTSKEFKLYAFVAELPTMELVEAKAYLDLSNWDLDEALRSAREDEGWSPGCGGGFASSSSSSSPAECSSPTIAASARPKALTARDVHTGPPPFDGDGLELRDIKSS